ncbi:hypothetical protein FLAG1_07823 [Fusarium langsethiae]|uniref:Uncharacterized protein n=1 Tax=Fusarium langsethiae TaxID=179993 RepID=A0A0M9ET17_FUSLA|nr:hypothetical protein FLAG1_07823 [Fusarium langsethiae]GKU05099.1 unnamed protein product [Fusarium langsethiae]GKU21531.1 unnamed protein product [Fusarium langsethiae]
MASQNENPPASYGANGAEPPLLPVASSNLSVIFEWAALLPLAIYLASSRVPYQLVGKIALAGFIPIGLFPRLGVLSVIGELLHQGQDYIDRVSSMNDSRRTVWDVSWGSVFPCANGAVSEILSAYLLKDAELITVGEGTNKEKVQVNPGNPIHNPETSQRHDQNGCAAQKLHTPNTTREPAVAFRRYQKLHIIHFSDADVGKSRQGKPLGFSHALHLLLQLSILAGLLGASVVCCLFGLYGTGAAIFLSILFRIVVQLTRIERPGGYLQSNESGLPGCMLVSIHENASAWYLYIGSRGVIDTMLNKTMIQGFTSPLHGWKIYSLAVLEVLQLAIMTYVAAQKGWDGVALLSLIIVAWTFDSVVYSDGKLAQRWIKRNGIQVETFSLQFSGRTPLIGTVQALGGHRVTSWMDGILAPSDRRSAWLQRLASEHVNPELGRVVSDSDNSWLDLNASAGFQTSRPEI